MFWFVPSYPQSAKQPFGCARGAFLLLVSLWVFGLSIPNTAAAQGGFNAATYLQQCLRFEAGGDLETARQSCSNALNIRPEYGAATLALARIEVALGKLGEAKSRLLTLPQQEAEVALLLAEIALGEDNSGGVSRLLKAAQRSLQTRPDQALEAQEAYLSGQLALAQRRSGEALIHFGQAVAAKPLETRYRLALARLQLALGDAPLAVQTLEGSSRSAELFSLLAQAQWVEGDLAGAARNFEAAVTARGFLDDEMTKRDLRNLVLVYYGQGDMQRGELAFKTALRRGELRETLLRRSTLWLVGFVLLLALHLMGESRVEQTSSLEPAQYPQPWTVGQVYRALFAALIGALSFTVLYGYFRYENLLAFLTPFQSAELRALFLAALALSLAGLALWRVRVNGWPPVRTLLGAPSQALLGVGLGALLLVGMLSFQAYASPALWTGYSLDTPLLPTLIAVLTLPLAELFFRAFAFYPLEQRYTPFYAVAISSTLYALVLGAPFPLLFIVGVILGLSYWRTKNGFVPLLAQLTFNVGLLLSVSGLLSAFF